MLDAAHLIRGLDALSRAHRGDYFADGHRGAAILAAWFFCQEEDVEEEAVQLIAGLIDEHWSRTPLCAPLHGRRPQPRERPDPGEAPDPTRPQPLVACMERGLGDLRQAGHNVILPSLALRVFHHRPQTCTRSRIEGLCALVDAFTVMDEVPLRDDGDVPDPRDATATAEFALNEFLRSGDAFDGRGQGWTGHLLTYARALLDLRALGWDGLVDQARHAFALYVHRIRLGPLSTDQPRREHPRSDLRPHQAAYWRRRAHRSVELGHLFKYPYGWYGLMRLARDEELKRRCRDAAWRIF